MVLGSLKHIIAFFLIGSRGRIDGSPAVVLESAREVRAGFSHLLHLFKQPHSPTQKSELNMHRQCFHQCAKDTGITKVD